MKISIPVVKIFDSKRRKFYLFCKILLKCQKGGQKL